MRKIYIIILFIVGIFIFFFNLGGRDLWDPDETRYAVIAREMRETGNWILPHLNGKVYAEKPPLFFWLINLFNFFFGENTEFSNRLPSAISGFVCLIITFFFGERLFSLRTGFFSSLVLATCFLFPQISRWLMLDSIFTLFFLLALFSFYIGYENEERRLKYYLLSGLFMGLGVLTKGPISYLTIPIFFIFTFFQKDLKRFWSRDLLLAGLISVVIVLIWWIPACLIGGKEYINWILFKQIVGTYVEGEKHFHPQPFYFYFIRFPLEFFPWIVFLPSSFIFGFKKNYEKRKQFLFISVWFVFLFLFFSLSKGKKDNYLLPLYPASALMVGLLWDRGLKSFEERRRFIFPLLFLIFLLLIPFFLISSGFFKNLLSLYKEFKSLGLYIILYLFFFSFLSLLLFIKGEKLASFLFLVAIFMVFHLHISYTLPQRLNERRSMKAFSERIIKRMKSGDEIKTFWFRSNGLIYYTKKPYIEEIETIDRFKEVFYSSQRVFIVVLLEMFENLKRDTGIEMTPIDQARVGHWNYVLISNQKD